VLQHATGNRQKYLSNRQAQGHLLFKKSVCLGAGEERCEAGVKGVTVQASTSNFKIV